ncbi:NAD(P)-dependent oxidoreductase [Roseiconus nitratireducens]|uniref:NAD(P)-dependent oxidoreductase n=1 Tax=Roseiconus nitratireducens TaxID=2605748 RepID=A0A5M6DE24_9BACT|nr:NAD(P)-dependent oxidoreductase [Roseiconus nitratireducens]KAA5544389.1 NAD(P)-dependent oxidoreductase [Roseiconus nitratireducens]
MRIALTGGTGFLGRHLIDSLLQSGHQVTAWCRSDPDTVSSRTPHVHWIRGELGQRRDAEQLAQSADAMIHAGWYRGGDSFLNIDADPERYWQINSVGALQLLESASRAGVNRFVFISSGAVHDQVLPDRPLDETHPMRPRTLYGACKASIEAMVHHYGSSGKLVAASVRPTSIYGLAEPASQSKWFELVAQIKRGKNVEATGGSKTVHASDVARSVALLLQQDDSIAGETFNCCDRMISDYEVAMLAKQLTGSPSQISGHEKMAKHEIETAKIRSIGMRSRR